LAKHATGQMKRLLGCLLGCGCALFTCSTPKPFLAAEYNGFWSESFFKYEFKPNGHFTFKTEGHIGYNQVDGKYYLGDSMIFLVPDGDHLLLHSVLKKVSKHVLRDNDNHLYCDNDDTLSLILDQQIEFEEKVEKILKIVTQLDKIVPYGKPAERCWLRIKPAGIVRLKGQEYQKFTVHEYNNHFHKVYIHQAFAVLEHPFSIYEINSDFSLKAVPLPADK
jgi:hypothetical protein